MAETTESAKKAKAKAPAKPRAAAGTKKIAAKKTNGAAIEANGPYTPGHSEIAVLALQYWEQRGRTHGSHMQDWLRAEQDLMKMAS